MKFYASLAGSSIDYACGTMEGPYYDRQDAQDHCDRMNASLADRGIPSHAAYWSVEPN